MRRRPALPRPSWGALVGLGLIVLGAIVFIVLPSTAIGDRAATAAPQQGLPLPDVITPTINPDSTGASGGGKTTPTPVTLGGPSTSLYARVDYPLLVAANSTSQVDLTLSTHDTLLMAAPSAGGGEAGVGAAAISLPTNLSAYQDIQAQAEAIGNSQGPILWQPNSPARQSLLSARSAAGQPVHYVDVTFRWTVRALAAGENAQSIKISIFYIYGGVEHPGISQETDAPIPIAVVQPTPGNTFLPWLRIPASAFLSLAGLLGLLHSFWTRATQTASYVNANIAPLVALVGNAKVATGLAKGAGQQGGRVVKSVQSIARHSAATATSPSGDPTGGDPTGGDPTGGDPTGGDPTGGDPTGGATKASPASPRAGDDGPPAGGG